MARGVVDVTAPSPIDRLATEIVLAIHHNAEHFPAHIKSRGRAYLSEGRVGPLEVADRRVSAPVRGSQSYRTSWHWDGAHADPQCTCSSGPICQHAYALARAIDAARHDGFARAAAEARERAREARAGDGRRPAFRGMEPRSGAAPDRPEADVAGDLARWARPRTNVASRALRVSIGLAEDDGRASVWMEVLVQDPRRGEGPRSAHALTRLGSDVRRDPTLLAPPDARLLRVIARILPHAEARADGQRFGLRASTLNRLLDSFSDSPLVTWADAGPPALEGRGGGVAGDRLRLGDATVDIVPVFAGDGGEMRITLAASWADGRRRGLDKVLYLPADDDLHPSLVIADGVFWRVADEPPPQLMRRFTTSGSLQVPAAGRAQFLDLLASSFASVGEALAPHVRVHAARPVLTLDLGEDDWLHVRCFAHTGDDAWRPGATQPGLVVFELNHQGQWQRIHADEALGDPDAARAPVGDSDPSAAGAVGSAEAATGGTDPSGGAPDGAGTTDWPAGDDATDAEAGAAPIWIEAPDPAPLEGARHWLAELAITRREGRRAPTDDARAESPGAWMRLGARNLKTFAEAWDRRPRDVLFLGNPRMRDLLGETRAVRPRVNVVASGVDWFTVSAEWQAEGLALTEADLARLRSARTAFVKLSSGWVRRDVVNAIDEAAEMLADLGVEAGGGEQRLSVAHLAQARPESLAMLEALGADPRTLREVERLREVVKNFAGVPRIPVPERLQATLRPYQRDGLDFLAFVTGLGMGAVLADDMGLGKTVQALAWIEWMRERDPEGGPVLVVCPASVVHNWQRESERFTPHLKVLPLTSGEERHALRREVPHHDLVVTNYALLRRDLENWRTIPLRAAVLDEAQNIKNPDAAVSRAVLELQARHRLALTGTPLENRALDLWSIMQFVNPGYFGPRSAFVARYDRPDAPPHARKLLTARLRPAMMRRLKEQVAPDLPDRIEERRECEMTPGQRKLYLAELMRGRATLERLKTSEGGIAGHKIEILAAITRLRQVCCHPSLVGGREGLGSGKFDALFEILEPLRAEGRKVLVFSQFVQCLKLLAAEMKTRGIGHHMLTGATTRREAVVTAFENDPDPCVFLISLKAGGAGLNLTAASYVVLFDPWWNPAVEAQAIDRAHRIGQTRTVIAYRMLAAGTIEDKIWELQERKAALAADVLGEDGFARTLTSEDLDDLLA